MWLVPFEVSMVPGDTPASEGNPGGLGWSRQEGGLLGRGDARVTASWTVTATSRRGWDARRRSHGPRGWESRIQRSPEESPDSS